MSDLQLNREELAWCAGFLDGEGSFVFKRKKTSCQFLVCAQQVDRAVLDRLQATLRGKVYGPYARTNPNAAPIHQWMAYTFEDAQNAMAQTWHWLSPVKRAQALNAFGEFMEYSRARTRR